MKPQSWEQSGRGGGQNFNSVKVFTLQRCVVPNMFYVIKCDQGNTEVIVLVN